MDISIYKCLKCSYKSKFFNDMTRHLNKNMSCPKKLEGYKYSEEELLKLSLLPYHNNKQNIDMNLLKNKNKYKISKSKLFDILNIIVKNKLKACPLCNKNCDKKYELKKHIILECVNIDLEMKDDIIENNNQCTDFSLLSEELCSKNNIINSIITNNNNNNNNNYNYNIDNLNVINNFNFNSPISFDEDWDVSHLSDEEKTVLIISMYKYTKTLESLLKNKNNHNVIIDKASNSGLVYKKNNIETMSLNEICDKSVDKINYHLNKFVDEVIKNNNVDVDTDYIMHSKKVIRIKHGNYKYNQKDRNCVNQILVDKFDNVKNDTLQKFNIINDNKIQF